MLRLLRLLTALVLALALTGCDVDWSHRPPGGGSLHGQVRIKPDGFPIDGAVLELNGPAYRRTSTSRNGTFAVAGLPNGRYNVTLRALHGNYTTSVWVRGSEVFHWDVQPAGIDRELFYQLSGLKRYYLDSAGRFTWDYGELVRWEKDEVRMYFHTAGAPPGFYSGWPDRYFQDALRWESILNGRINIRRVYSASEADIVVIWQPAGFLGNHAGIARHLAYYENGSLKLVQIEIDVRYGGETGLWAHELAHGMGVEHVTDPGSVMYPRLESGQRTWFSSLETDHVRLMYDIPSGQRLGGFSAMGLDEGGANSGDAGSGGVGSGAMGFMSLERPTGYRGHVVTSSGTHADLDEWDVQQLLEGALR